MNFEKYTNYLRRIANFGLLSRLPSQEEFQAIIHREIARVDRRSGVISLVCFKIDDDMKNTWKEITIIKEISRRIRSTDMIGRMKKNGIGVVLYGTPESGAQKLAINICLEIATIMPPPYYAVYTYPTHWYPNSSSKRATKSTANVEEDSDTLTAKKENRIERSY